ncbi:MAG: type II toxin-antitoxin system Phd/YefM family antitoxin [Deltaproteobacteria bacterium]|nr:type II toxin-antitoxin system Phd/YefM family antitoxin [Deltaproteobacteria bacterium]MBW1940520.1 type II toxin-antitoxin system Phd/YefM family antitoxin [Deltaproteobacteria bacterium]MBW2099515.1 type II toxin-antitoxin system Phd/YefM family antitoxin [Deltaproteobacteria bacterium]
MVSRAILFTLSIALIVIITQHGKGVAVLLGAHEYEAMQEKLELLTDIQKSLNQLEKGAGISYEDAKEKVLKRVQSSSSRNKGKHNNLILK